MCATMIRLNPLLLLSTCLCVGIVGCSDRVQESSVDSVPEWAQEAIWYQIFVERFNNGDRSNDPTLQDIEGSWPHLMPEGFETTSWTSDWFKQEDWAEQSGEPFYLTVQSRRYGGDLQGVLDKLDYLDSLGVTALYINPINDAPSLHKFDARTYRHIDRNFGPDPVGDAELIASENPTDPSSWKDTAADRLFFKLIEEAHVRDMKIVVDVSWNHTGIRFWAWQDILKRQSESPYADWYRIDHLDDPTTPESEFEYRGWAGVAELPELTKVGVPEGYDGGPVDGNLHPEVKDHIFNVTARWLDPNGDGDPSDGIDGFRLDVAEKVPLGFWREYRSFVRSINPHAYLIGEIWWEDWPETMLDPEPWLVDVFDAVMHYRWYMPTRSLFSGAPPHLTPSDWVVHMDSIESVAGEANLRSFMNLTASHDSPRFSTSMQNPQQYKYGMGKRDNDLLDDSRPTPETMQSMRMLLIQQFTWKSSPHIWNGDELGMWGGDDPDNRKPLWWPELSFEPESTTPSGNPRSPVPVYGDTSWLRFYQDLTTLRTTYKDALVWGEVVDVQADDALGMLAYTREGSRNRVRVVFNLSEETREVSVDASRMLMETGGVSLSRLQSGFELRLPARSAAAILLQ